MRIHCKKLLHALLTLLLSLCVFTALPSLSRSDDDIYFYRTALSQMDETGKLTAAYDVVVDVLASAETTADISGLGITPNDLKTVAAAVYDDHPEFFWYRGSYLYNYDSHNMIATSFIPEYYFTGEKLEEAKTAFDSRVDEILAGITDSMTLYQKEKYVHDTLATSTRYVSGELDQSAYSALILRESVCAGYTRAFQLIMQRLGIQCMYVSGNARHDNELHAWDIVRLDGEYYHVDLTWDDAEWSLDFSDSDDPDDVSSTFYSYFNITDSDMFTDHTVSQPDSYSYYPFFDYLPECSGTKYGYYSQNHSDGRSIKVDDSLTIDQLLFALENPVDDATRVFFDDSYGQYAAVSTILRVFQENSSVILPLVGNGGRLSATYPNDGHDIQLRLSSAAYAMIHGNIEYYGDPSNVIGISIRNQAGKEVFKKNISGIGASYIAYALPADTYTVTATLGNQSISQSISVAAGDYAEADFTLTGGSGIVTPDDPWETDPDDPDDPTETPVSRLFGEAVNIIRSSGAGRYETAIETANKLKTALGIVKFNAIIVASSHNFPDALAGSYLAARKNAPILIVRATATKNGLDLAVDYIKNNLSDDGTVYILGGTSAVTDQAESAIRAVAKNVKRLAGKDRYETNLLILKEAGIESGSTLLVADGRGFADALSASALGMPIMLINNKKDRVSAEQEAFLKELGDNGIGLSLIVVLGGKAAVPDSIKYDFSSRVYPGVIVDRIDGSTRYETSANIAAYFFENPQAATLATGVNFPDGLTGGSLAYALRAPLILTRNKDKDIKTTADCISKAGVERFVVFGGESALPDSVISAVSGK